MLLGVTYLVPSLQASQSGTFLPQDGVCLLAQSGLELGTLFCSSGKHTYSSFSLIYKSLCYHTSYLIVLLLLLLQRDEKSQLMVGVRRANRQQSTLPSSVLSADSMHIGVLAAAAHAAANRSPFTIFYNPRFLLTPGLSSVCFVLLSLVPQPFIYHASL